MRFTKTALTLLLWIGICLFWGLVNPFILGFQEQNQLFLFTWDYLADRLARAGGFADWIAEFLTQFNLIPWLGAALLASLLTLMQILVWRVSGAENDGWYPLSFIPSALMLVSMGDIYTMPSHAVAICLALGCALAHRKTGYSILFGIIAVPLLYWIAGPAVWIFVISSVLSKMSAEDFSGRSAAAAIPALLYTALLVVLSRYTFMSQYPMKAVIFGSGYYRMPLVVPALQPVTAGSAALIPFVLQMLPEFRRPATPAIIISLAVVGAAFFGVTRTYDKGTRQAIVLDQLVRQERWDDAVSAARKYMPQSPECYVNLNLALCMSGHPVDDIAGFEGCGTQGLIMPRVRDLLSNVGSYEVFWRLGMVNSSLRYAFDSQESEMNNAKSGRHMSRIAECHMVNGNWQLAEKYLDILSHSLFYRKWAKERKAMIEDGARPDNLYLYLQSVRYKEDFLFSYPEMDKMLARLYHENQDNKMASWYYYAWKSLAEQEQK